MASKTFKSSRPTGTLLRVDSTEVFSEAHLTIVLRSREEDICIDPSDAPALALAILEVAGFEAFGADYLNKAVDCLQQHNREREREATEAKEQAELEAEALAFYEAFTGYTHVTALDEATPIDKWLAVARKAREMRSEK